MVFVLDIQERERVSIQGLSQTGKTSVLFENACYLIENKHKSGIVVFITSLQRSSLPKPFKRSLRGGEMLWSCSTLSRIGMKYIDSVQDFILYLSSLHLLPPTELPFALIIDDLDYILNSSNDSAAEMMPLQLKAIAMLDHAANFITSTKPNDPPCQVLVSMKLPVQNTLLGGFVSHWISSRWEIEQDGDTHVLQPCIQQDRKPIQIGFKYNISEDCLEVVQYA
mmetsp:Transcript_6486/g.9805  ORF Transcript_6486/g.9805 Transcript_6486/m.9805 type:complete len:224 (-) Transcript_6486:75-746(-)